MASYTRGELIEKWAAAVRRKGGYGGVSGGEDRPLMGLPVEVQAAIIQAAAMEYATRGHNTTGFYLAHDNRDK